MLKCQLSVSCNSYLDVRNSFTNMAPELMHGHKWSGLGSIYVCLSAELNANADMLTNVLMFGKSNVLVQ